MEKTTGAAAAISDESLLRVDAAARFLNISEVTLRRHVALRKVPFVKFGGAVRFKLADLRAFINQATIHPPKQRRVTSPAGRQKVR
jgi:excisionase family DNA binding protein